MRLLFRAEVLKLRTTRLFPGLTVATAATVVALVVLRLVLDGGGSRSAGPPISRVAPTQDQLRELLAGLKPTVQLVALVLGAMALGEEFQHGTAMRTFLAAPRRRRVLLAKLAVHGAAAGLVGMVAVLCALATVAVWLGIDGAALPLGATSLTALAAVPLFAALACLLALGVGAMLRSSLATIAVILGWVLVVEPMLTASLPDSRAWLAFAGAGEAIVGAGGTDLLSRPAATLVFCAYIAVAAMVGGRVLAGRDVA